MEKRTLNVSFNKGGSGSLSARLALPKKWLDDMEISQEAREVIAEYDGVEIRIRKSGE